MIDLETLGIGVNAPIISAGVVLFNTDKQDTWSELAKPERTQTYKFNLQESLDRGLKIDASTFYWWLKQSQEARGFLGMSEHVKHSNTEVLKQINEFVRGVGRLWGNGANFDNPILRNHFNLYDVPFVLPYYADRCYRTVAKAYPKIKVVTYGIEHDPAADAVTQVMHLQRLTKEHGVCV